MQIIFIGGGNMAEAIFAKLEILNIDIIVVQRNSEKRTRLAAKYKFIRFIPTLDIEPTQDDLVILAVKPQDAKESCEKLLLSKSTIVSVMAGINTVTLIKWLNNHKVARVMSNTPASLGIAASGIYFSEKVPQHHKKQIDEIMSAIGKTYIFDDENFIDKFTAVAASSPAYIFYFIEGMIDTAIKQFGFSKEIARDITLQVAKGSIAMIEKNNDISIKQLRANVTSKKGTTEQAINVFDKANLQQIIEDAEVACYGRARELGNALSKD